MAVRVRKLAKELGVHPDQVLALLSELGYDRYKSDQDMVADPAADKVRKQAASLRRRGRTLPPAQRPRRAAQRPTGTAASTATAVDQREALAEALDQPLDVVAAAAPVDDRARAMIAEASEAVRAEQAALHAQARKLRERAASLESQADQLRIERDALQAERRELLAELAAARQEIASRAADLDAIEAGGVPVAQLLDERGLRGSDEHGRALAALATARLLDPVVARLRVIDAGPVRRLLADRLVLGEAPFDGLDGVAVVQVAADRAELPSPLALQKLRDRLWEECLLCGLRRVRVLGGRPLEHRLLAERVDARIQLSILPVGHRDGVAATSDIDEIDLLVLRDVELAPSVADRYAQAGLVVVDSGAPGIGGLIHDVLRALSSL